MIMADTGAILSQMQVHHKYQGNGKDPRVIASHRPLGLSGPCLSLLSDILHMRLNITTAASVGSNQQGGQTDPRYLIIWQSDVEGIRIQMGLPTVESSADARFGVDGGRHSQVLTQLHRAGARPQA